MSAIPDQLLPAAQACSLQARPRPPTNPDGAPTAQAGPPLRPPERRPPSLTEPPAQPPVGPPRPTGPLAPRSLADSPQTRAAWARQVASRVRPPVVPELHPPPKPPVRPSRGRRATPLVA